MVVQTEGPAGPPPSHSFIDFLGRRLLFEAHTVLISASMHSFTAASFSFSAATRLEPALPAAWLAPSDYMSCSTVIRVLTLAGIFGSCLLKDM